MISVKHIQKTYRTNKALSDFSYDFNHGIYAILGPNGSGKSTLMNIMTDNLKKDAGEIILGDSSSTPNDLHISYVSQYPGMYGNFTVYEMLDYTAILKRAKNASEQIAELMDVFMLTDFQHKKVKSLSGGMKQRLAIALAFIGEPSLVILDEPTAGLDPLQRIRFKNFIAKQGENMTVIISTHIVSDVETIANEVIFLKKGKIVLSGSIDACLKTIDGKCFKADVSEMPENISLPHRFVGNEVRILAEQCPFEKAIPVTPELEDCYLSIFGEDI